MNDRQKLAQKIAHAKECLERGLSGAEKLKESRNDLRGGGYAEAYGYLNASVRAALRILNGTTIQQAAAYINNAAIADSNVCLSIHTLERLLQEDHAANGQRIPSKDECEKLVMGDDDGDIPPDLCIAFPATHHYLQEKLT